MTVIPGESPCLRCLLPDGQVPKDADSAAKACIGATCAVIGGLQVMEVYKYILGLPCNTKGFFVFDGMEMAAQQLLISANPQCSCRKKE